MARYRRRWAGNRYGSERARQHIQEARQFSSEVGGVDNDVKQYFFSLSRVELDALLNEYGRKYGADKRQYAESAYAEWKSGRRQMSGDVAKRLFDLLPNRMPLSQKYELVRKLWEFFCPKSHEIFYVGNGSDSGNLRYRVSAHFQKVVTDYFISNDLSERFDWLAAGDVQIRQQLQNYFQQLKKEYLAKALQERIDVVSSHLGSCPEDHTIQTVRIGNHVVDVKRTLLADGISDASTINKIREERDRIEQRKENLKSLLWFLFSIGLFVALLKACGR